METTIYRIRVYFKDKIYSQTYQDNLDLNRWLNFIKKDLVIKIEFKKLIIKEII